ncbi:sulfatase-like hydrolase/transferase [bacterium]|nr:sulfatase-like hydrolase/transferase [bacterium]
MRQIKAVQRTFRSLKKKWQKQSKKHLIQDIFVAAAFAGALPLLAFTKADAINIRPIEAAPIVALYALTAVAVFIILWPIESNRGVRLTSSIVVSYIFLVNFAERFDLVKQFAAVFLPEGGIGALIAPLAFVVAVLVGVLLLVRLADKILTNMTHNTDWLRGVLTVMALFVSGYLLLGFINSVRKYSQYYSYKNTPSLTADGAKQGDRDIYYIVFDRYPSQASLANYYNFDNSGFIEKLRGQGFTIRDNAYSNFQFTSPSVSSTLNMDFHTDLLKNFAGKPYYSELPYQAEMQNSNAVNLLKKSGYEIYNVGSWWGSTKVLDGSKPLYVSPELTLLGKKYIPTEYQGNMIKRSVWGPLLSLNLSFGGLVLAGVQEQGLRDNFLRQLEALKTISATKSDKPRFIFAHILNPHPDYVFTADGNKPSYDTTDSDNDLPRAIKLTNQLQFTNRMIEDLVTSLKKSEKQPVIAIQADEGPYPQKTDFTAFTKATDDALREKTGILAAYYLPDMPEEKKTELSSSVNLFRFLLNNYMGSTLPYLPDCHFVFDNATPYSYKDLGERITGQPTDPKCAELVK